MNYEEIEQYDNYKTKVLKYVLYKKRTEFEIKNKFKNDIDENILQNIIEELKVNNYIRFHFAKKEETLREALKRLEKLKEYKK